MHHFGVNSEELEREI